MPANDIQIVVLMIVFAVCLLIVAVFFFLLIEKYRRILEKRQMEALNNLIIGQDNERERLSRDLHDQIGPQINAVALLLSNIRGKDEEEQNMVKELGTELKQVQNEVRNISHDLMSGSLIRYGLVNAIKKLAERNSLSGLKIRINSNAKEEGLGERQISHLYSVVKELMMNTVKHANATEVDMDFIFDALAGNLVFRYSDNGSGGIAAGGYTDGIGLGNIRTRVRLMQGELKIDMDHGFKAEIVVKLKHGN